MGSKDRPFPHVVGVGWRDAPAASLPKPGSENKRKGRDETELLRALTKALGALLRGGAPESALRESFASAMAGLGAEKGLLVQVERPEGLDVEILYANGLSPENEAACRALRSSPGVSPSLIRKAIEDGEAR